MFLFDNKRISSPYDRKNVSINKKNYLKNYTKNFVNSISKNDIELITKDSIVILYDTTTIR